MLLLDFPPTARLEEVVVAIHSTSLTDERYVEGAVECVRPINIARSWEGHSSRLVKVTSYHSYLEESRNGTE